ncbi:MULTISPECIES: redox-sensitive transcriptional activator SoxR [unclassified Photobacterium]|uniref:redox-sensitive transcriptional activator SoxR n=1 Tax=unclassified Photobacterium TaxID=2628852 RepID=UPI001B8C3B70|nr:MULTISPECIES: redox-sensitive transcriptional activator SoxR [unclassified Photobacterium]MDO6707226.1 redox-sensitive transcriptional activator SoxR [Photobacterium sp. 1_MG-2023]QUJ69854.1 redox-sensitive transcriptional activator SoxR [Photobacterium sp. GJ3]
MEMSVGQVAQRSNVRVSTLHFYEEKGLIQSWRNPGNQRRYDRSVLRRIAVIKTAQQLGFSLEDIGVALSHLPLDHAPTQEEWQEMASAWREQLDERIQKLQQMRDSLGNCIGCGCLSLKKCQLRNPDDALASEGTGAVLLDGQV